MIIIFFQIERSRFDSADQPRQPARAVVDLHLLGAAEIFALILSEIDLSVGFVLAVGGFVIAELIASPVNFPWWLGIICGVGVTAAIGYLQGSLITRLHVPSFVVTLAGLLFLRGGGDRARHDRQVGGRRRDLGLDARAPSSSS